MIKADIVKKVAEKLNLKDKEALVIVDATLEAIKHTVATYGRLEIRDFGVLQVKQRKQRTGRNPKDKREYPIPARRVVTFKMGKELKASGLLTTPDSHAVPDTPAAPPEQPSGDQS